MVAFLRWLRSILFGTLNGLAKLALAVVLILVVLLLVGLFKGDGLPRNMVLTLDLRKAIADSAPPTPFDIGQRNPTVMDVETALDEAGRDSRVKGVLLQLGNGSVSTAQAEELGAAFARFRAKGKFVTAYSHGFLSAGLGDYLLATSANEIWMQPQSTFSPAGAGVGEVFLRGLFDKIQAEPQIVKRADYKSAADMFMEKSMTPADREQLTALLQSAYNSATAGAASARKLPTQLIVSSFEKSPQFAEQAQKEGLIDKLAYDDDAELAVLKKAGEGAKKVSLGDFLHARDGSSAFASGPKVALIQASGEIVDGSVGGNGLFGGNNVIASDDMAKTIRQAADDKDVKAIVLRVDSPGGSVSASDQILDALKKAQKKGKPVVVSMGSVAASGGYYISAYANRIVAQPGTITGSIGVLTGKVSIGKSLGLIGVSGEQVSVGKNALFDSPLEPFTPDQLANLNAQADAIYADFKKKVATGRNLPIATVDEIAKGRVWSGADAKTHGLVDQLGGVWDAGEAARKLAKMPTKDPLVFKRYPREKGFFDAMNDLMGSTEAGASAMEGLIKIMNLPPIHATLEAMQSLPKGGIELRAPNLPRP
jgi:protease-4